VDEERRLYPRDGFAAHLIGYVGEVSEEMLNNPKYAYYEPGDVVGKAGVEQTYDELLRGQDGSMDVVVDSHGREVGRRAFNWRRRAGSEADGGYRYTARGGAGAGFGEWSGDGDGPAERRDSGAGFASELRPECICGEDWAVGLEQADYRPESPADEQGDSGSAGAGVYVQDDHVGGWIAGRDCAEPQGELLGWRDFLRALFQVRPSSRIAEHPRGDSGVLRYVFL
jgi:hypothetical protein